MKTSFTSIAKVAGGLALMAASSAAMASVLNTVHNLSVNGTATHVTGAGATTEICIFCHTPHGGDQSVNAPIWNRTVSSTSVYTRFSSMGRITFDADEAPVGGVSIACLSCHDGTQARDAVINGPGSGPNGNSVNDTNFATTWLDGTSTSTAYLSDLNPSDNGSLSGDLIYLGTDLRNDHPISMQYGGGGYEVGTTPASGQATRDPDFAAYQGGATGGYGSTAANNAPASSTNAGITGIATGAINIDNARTSGVNSNMFYVDTGGSGYQATDFPLYTRTDGTLGSGEPMVECGTCHDPHSSQTTFLRLPGGNVGSQVCLTCHAK